MADEQVRTLIERWRQDADGTYQSWFLWEERLKNFRSIRRGLQQVVDGNEGGDLRHRWFSPFFRISEHMTLYHLLSAAVHYSPVF